MEHLNELVLLLPDYELEGYPRDLPRDQAARLLSGWVALWHPTLLCGVGKIPRWHPASRLPPQLDSVLFALPSISAQSLEANAAERIEAAGGLLIEPLSSWRQFQSKILSLIPAIQPNSLADEMAEQFAALGYGYLQVQLMTRQLRYSSNLDVAVFEEQTLKATEAVLANDRPTAEQYIQACFDSLGQERDHYYSNDAHLIDMTLLAETTLAGSLARQLDDIHPTTIIAQADLLRKMRDRSGANFDRLRQRLAGRNLCLAGGMESECLLPLMPYDSAQGMFKRASSAYRDLEIDPPKVFARMNVGLTPEAIGLLKQSNFLGAILIAFTGGKFPIGRQPKISWEDSDGNRMPALATAPLDADSPSAFLALGLTIGEALDQQHVPTLVFAHWPGRECEYYRLLKILASHTPALGQWCLVDDYFSNTDSPYHHQKLDPESFAYDWLADSDSPARLIQSVKWLHRLAAHSRSLQNMANLIWQLQRIKDKPKWLTSESGELVAPVYQALRAGALDARLDELQIGIDGLTRWEEAELVRLQGLTQDLTNDFLMQLARLLAKVSNDPVADTGSNPGRLLFNPRSSPVRVAAQTSPTEAFEQSQPWHFASGLETIATYAGGHDPIRTTCIDLPTMGFVVSPTAQPSRIKAEKIRLADANGLLSNEFIEAQIDLKQGHLRSLQIPAVRGNRLSAMLMYREMTGSESANFSEITTRQVSVVAASSMSGSIRSKGQFVFRGKSIGVFEIDYEILRGSRIVVAAIKLSNLVYPIPIRTRNQSKGRTPSATPWQNAFVLRWAWSSEAANVYTFANDRRAVWAGGKVFEPQLIEIDEVNRRTQLLTGGLAFHRRQDRRFAETVLAVPGQTDLEHKIGFAVDLPHALSAAKQLMEPVYELPITGVEASASGWLMHADVKNIVVNLESPLEDAQGKNVGMRVSISEVAGRVTTASIRWFRNVAAANLAGYAATAPTPLSVSGDQTTITLRAGQRVLVDILWQA